MKFKKLTPLICLSTMFIFASCEKDSVELNTSVQEGYLQVELILNPSIHPYAESVVLDVMTARIGDTESNELVTSEPLLFDELAEPTPLQLGERAVLTPGGYTNCEFDFTAGEQNGSYVVTADERKDVLDAVTGNLQTVSVDGNFLIDVGATTKRIMFLDMNKLVSTSRNGNIDFCFKETSSTERTVRFYDPKEIGSISGTLLRTTSTPRQTHRLVVYAYPLGQFSGTEEAENGFHSATISANVRSNDQFTFPVLPEGVFELVVVEYQDQNQDNILEYKNLLEADSDVNKTTRLARVSKGTETQVIVKVGGIVAD